MPRTPSELKQDIVAYAHALGFGRVGMAVSDALPLAEAALGSWLAQGCAGEMNYMEKNWQTRARPEELLPGARSVIALAMSYYNDASPTPQTSGGSHLAREGEGLGVRLQGRIARYAWGKDYHRVIQKRLESLVRYMEALSPEVRCKTYLDTGPLLERAVTQKAGLGFVGKNTMLITRGLGSYVFLASVLTTLELPADASDARTCGSCTLCIDACPTQAITEPYHLDARRCISYLTIESKDPIPEDLRSKTGDWLFGCDICQDVCPHNTRLPMTPITEFKPEAGIGPFLDLDEVLSLENDQDFNTRFAGTPLKRPKREGLQRNAHLVAENQARGRSELTELKGQKR